jgi:hypothetical protein
VAPAGAADASADLYREVEMQSFLHDENIALYRKLIAESEGNPSRDEDRHAMLLTLLAEEKAKAQNPTVRCLPDAG